VRNGVGKVVRPARTDLVYKLICAAPVGCLGPAPSALAGQCTTPAMRAALRFATLKG